MIDAGPNVRAVADPARGLATGHYEADEIGVVGGLVSVDGRVETARGGAAATATDPRKRPGPRDENPNDDKKEPDWSRTWLRT
jgi:hypothetical protein